MTMFDELQERHNKATQEFANQIYAKISASVPPQKRFLRCKRCRGWGFMMQVHYEPSPLWPFTLPNCEACNGTGANRLRRIFTRSQSPHPPEV